MTESKRYLLVGVNDTGEIVEKRVTVGQKAVKKAFLEGQGYKVEEFSVVEEAKKVTVPPPAPPAQGFSPATGATISVLAVLIMLAAIAVGAVLAWNLLAAAYSAGGFGAALIVLVGGFFAMLWLYSMLWLSANKPKK